MSDTGALPPTGQRWSRPHWIRLDTYLNHHASHMRSLERRYGVQDGLSIGKDGPSSIVIQGRVICQHGLFLDVHKILDLRDDGMVSGYRYKYQACLETDDRTHELFRYDNAHDERPYPGHPDPFHKHTVDGQIVWIGLANWPTLTQVIEELHEWWQKSDQHMHWE